MQYCSNLPELQIALISAKKKMSTVAKFKFSSLLGKDLYIYFELDNSERKEERKRTNLSY